jgi:hypothetical protein
VARRASSAQIVPQLCLVGRSSRPPMCSRSPSDPTWHSTQMFFDDTIRDALLHKHGSKLSSHRPEYFALATDPTRQQQRAWVNRTLSSLDSDGANALFHNLQTPGRFIESYNELAVAAILQTTGMKLGYERDIQRKTPDFLALDADDHPTHIVEVLNRKKPKAVDAADRRWQELIDRFAVIDEAWRVRVARFSGDRGGPHADEAIHLVRVTEKWLTSNPIAINAGWSIGDYVFSVVAKSPGTQVELLTPIEEVWVDSDTLAKAIRDKVSRYDDLAEQLGIPLVVVVGADDNLAVSSDTVKSALGGQLTVSVNLNVWGVGTGSTKSRPMKMHATDAPRSWNAVLSAVGWLEAAIGEPGVMTLFPYDRAVRHHGIASSNQLVLR